MSICKKHTGKLAYTQVSGSVSFRDYLEKHMTDDQRKQWLGPERFKLWKKGNLPLDKFIPPYPDKRLTVDALKELDKQSFIDWLKGKLKKKTSDNFATKAKQQSPEKTKDELHREHLKKRKEQLEKARLSRVKREAKSIGAKMIDGTHTIEDDLKTTNPNFKQGDPQWGKNCQRCVTAYEMRRRGINVEAMPREADLDGFSVLTQKDGTLNPTGYIASVYKNAKLKNISATTQNQCKMDIQNKMIAFGDGSRAIVRVRWGAGGGHAFIAEQVNGQTRFIDPQSGNKEVSKYFSLIKPEKTCLIRVDNLKINVNVRKCCKPR